MLDILLVPIIMLSDVRTIPGCDWKPEVLGCYIHETVYIDDSLEPFMTKKVLYHELGHHILGTDEELVQDFTRWMLNKDFNQLVFKGWYPVDNGKFFREKCDYKCISDIKTVFHTKTLHK